MKYKRTKEAMGSPAVKQRQRIASLPVRAHDDAPVALDWRLVVTILVAAAVPRVALAVEDQGIFWPDEIFQSLEQAHRVVFGYGFIPWEFQDGARSWLFPGAFAMLWKLAGTVGVHSGMALVLLAKLSMVAIALVGVYATIRIAERLGGSKAGVLAGLLAATFPASLIFGHRCMTEMASGSVLALAVWLWLDGERRRMFLAGLLTSLAIFLRYQNALVAIGLLVALLVSARRREAITFLAGGAVGLLGGEILDWITWGSPFHSLLVYLRYNLVQGRSADYGVSSRSYYLETAWSSTGVSSLAIATGVIAAWSRARALVAVAIGFVVVHSFIAHKEYRFVMSVVPLLLALSAVGLQTLLARRKGAPRAADRWRRYLPVAVLGGAMSVLMVVKSVDATLASTGQWSDETEGPKSVWHHWEGANLALADAGRRNDLCGVLLVGLGAAWSGGFTYLHRDVPFLTLDNAATPGDLLPFANYVILSPDVEPPPGYVALEEVRGWSVRRREGECVSPPRQLTRLFDNPQRP